MKNIRKYTFCILIALLALPPAIKAQSYQDEFLSRWAGSEQYSLDVLNRMPDSGIQFKVDSSAMSFGEQLIHMGKTISMLSKNFLKAKTFDLTINPANASKDEIARYISACYRYGAESVRNLNEEDLNEEITAMGSQVNRRQVLTLMLDHTTHHRGGAVVYLRIYGAEPPPFRRF